MFRPLFGNVFEYSVFLDEMYILVYSSTVKNISVVVSSMRAHFAAVSHLTSDHSAISCMCWKTRIIFLEQNVATDKLIYYSNMF